MDPCWVEMVEMIDRVDAVVGHRFGAATSWADDAR
jgi:hypothetical protein